MIVPETPALQRLTAPDIAAFYHAYLVPTVADIEAARQKAVASFVWRAGMALVLNGILIGLMLIASPQALPFGLTNNWPATVSSSSGESPFFFWQVALVAIIAFGLFACWPLWRFKDKTKSTLMAKIVLAFPGFEYAPQQKFEAVWLRQSGLFGDYDYDNGGDFIGGVYKNVRISTASVHLVKERRTQKNDRREETVFHGVVYHFDFPRRFHGVTRVRRDGGWLGNRLGGLFNGLQRVTLEDPQFEKLFEVYSTDQIEARYLLTTGFMQLLLNVAARHKNRLEASFFDGSLLIKVAGHGARLTLTNPLRKIDWQAEVTRFIEEFQAALALVDELKLNQRIGL